MNIQYNFEADWRPYAFPQDESHLATESELQDQYTTVALSEEDEIPSAGIPILSDGDKVTFNTENEMNIIFGATGSKKSRVLIAPYICACAQAGESMIIPDIKGELSQGALSAQIRGVLATNDYSVRVIDFRGMSCDGYNILLEPYHLYRQGNRDEAMTEVSRIISGLAGFYHGSSADPFWEKTASQYMMAVTILLFELCDDPKKINMLSLASYTNEESCEYIKRVIDQINCENNIMAMLRSVISEPEKTRMSTLATVNSFFSDFIINESLLKMLSTTTFEIEELFETKTALFLIIPDETDAFSRILGLLLSQISSFLVRAAYRLGGALPRRVNYICDEFLQYYIPNMAKNISAHRSRNIRWTIVCQSRKQLEMVYEKDAATILSNCTNIFFLSSPESELLEDLSQRAGYTNASLDGQPRRLLSVPALRGMKKGWDYTDVFFCSGSTVCVNKLPDISKYHFVSKYYQRGKLELKEYPELIAYSPGEMLADIIELREAFDMEERGQRKSSQSIRKKAERYRNMFRSHNKLNEVNNDRRDS